MAGEIRVGTSGWNYDHWKEIFYPADLPPQRWFARYAEKFNTVEINNTFYNQPPNTTFDTWRKQAPAGFLYAVKANRYVTHMKKLKDPEKPLRNFLGGAGRLKSHLGPLLFQLPPHWKKNLDRLQTFCQTLVKLGDHRYVVEFRERDWLAEDTYEILQEFGVGLCVHDMLPRHPRRVTGSLVYVRFHGTGKDAGGKYPPSRLRPWAEWIAEAADERDVFVYFNNDAHGYALADAEALREMVEDTGG